VLDLQKLIVVLKGSFSTYEGLLHWAMVGLVICLCAHNLIQKDVVSLMLIVLYTAVFFELERKNVERLERILDCLKA
jgi:hypothetical protein